MRRTISRPPIGPVSRDDHRHAVVIGPARELGDPGGQRAVARHDRTGTLHRVARKQDAALADEPDDAIRGVAGKVMQIEGDPTQIERPLVLEPLRRRHERNVVPPPRFFLLFSARTIGTSSPNRQPQRLCATMLTPSYGRPAVPQMWSQSAWL